MIKPYSVINLIFLVLFWACNEKAPEKKPNIILIVVDDLGYADLGFLPDAAPDVSTPNIDRLAARSTYFSRAYATSPICSPSRAGLITGRYQQRWGNYWYGEGGLPENEMKLPQLLKDQGYFTAKIGKNHLNGGPVEHPLDHGYEYFLGFMDHTWDYLRLSEEDEKAYGVKNAKRAHIGALMRNRKKVSFQDDYTTDIFSREAISIIEQQNDPFFIHLSYNAVHHPTYVGHPAYLGKFGLKQFPFWDPAVESYVEWHKKWGHLGEVDPDGRKRYLLQLNVLDDRIGEIMESLEKSNKLENTIIVLLSDNGGTINTYANNQPLSGYKYMFGEGGIRIPMIWYVPFLGSDGEEKKQLVSAMDILPTLSELIGAKPPKDVDGVSLVNILKGKQEKAHDWLFWSDGRDQWVAMNPEWKLAHNTGWMHANYKTIDGRQVRSEPYAYGGGIQLYDLERDKGEYTDRVAQHPEVVEAMVSNYWKWRAQMSDPRKSNGALKNIAGGYPKQHSLPARLSNVYSSGSHINHYASKAFDGDPETYWQSKQGNDAAFLPYHITTVFKQKERIAGLHLVPKDGNNTTSSIKALRCFVSEDGSDWEQIVQQELKKDFLPKSIKFSKPLETLYLKLQIDELYEGPGTTAISELKWVYEE